MLTKVHTGLDPVPGVWWKPAHKSEKIWVSIAFVWCIVLFAMMPLWHWKGGQNPSGIRTRVEPKAFYARTVKFAQQYKIGDDRGLPIVAPPPGGDVYLVGLTYQWYPILQLTQGVEYTLHLSSFDVKVGDTVTKGQTLGRSGTTGLAGGDHLHFTMLVGGHPVNPVEWWDPHWIQDRVARKLGPALAYQEKAAAAPAPAAGQ